MRCPAVAAGSKLVSGKSPDKGVGVTLRMRRVTQGRIKGAGGARVVRDEGSGRFTPVRFPAEAVPAGRAPTHEASPAVRVTDCRGGLDIGRSGDQLPMVIIEATLGTPFASSANSM